MRLKSCRKKQNREMKQKNMNTEPGGKKSTERKEEKKEDAK